MIDLAPGAIKLIAICSVFLVLAFVLVGLRLWSRRLKSKSLEINDWLMLASLLLTTVLTILIFAGAVIGGAGQHISYVQSASNEGTGALEKAAKVIFVVQPIWLTTNTLIKLSTLHFYITIFRTRSFRIVVYMVMAFTVASWVAFFLKDFLNCLPLERNWTIGGDPGGFCGITTAGTITTGAIVLITDVVIVFLPMPLLWTLQMPTSKKITISAIFGIGIAVCISSALRLDSVLSIDYNDLPYTVVDLGIYSILEPCVGIIDACLPTLQPMLAKLVKSDAFAWARNSSLKSPRLSAKRSQGSTHLSSRVTRSDSDTRHFDRLYDHMYPSTPTWRKGDEERGPTELHDMKDLKSKIGRPTNFVHVSSGTGMLLGESPAGDHRPAPNPI